MKLHLTLPLALLLAAPTVAQEADSAPAAPAAAEFALGDLPPLFAKAAKNLERPWECDLSLELDSPDGPAKGTGHLRYFYHGLFAFDFSLETGREGQTEKVDLHVLADDEYLHFHIDQGQGGAFAAKFRLDLFEGGPAALLNAPVDANGMNPGELLEMASALKFTEEAVDGGKQKRLTADLSELIPEGDGGPEELALSLDFDAKHAFPRALSIRAGDEGSLALRVTGLSFPEDMDQDSFRYQGPPAIDFTAQIEMALRQSGAEVEEEF